MMVWEDGGGGLCLLFWLDSKEGGGEPYRVKDINVDN